MKQSLNCLLLAGLVLLLSACGFHLRGLGGSVKELPFSTMYLEAANTGIEADLRTVLARNSKLTLLPAAKQAQAVVTVLNENQFQGHPHHQRQRQDQRVPADLHRHRAGGAGRRADRAGHGGERAPQHELLG